MKFPALCLGLLLACGATKGMAEPCVSSTFDVPIPSAVDVVTRHADVPSPKFPGLWQEGSLDGYFYALYANGEGILKSARETSEWDIRVVCEADEGDCSIKTNGVPPEDAQGVVDILTLCLQGQPLTSPEIPTPEPETPEPQEVIPCGLATIPEGPAGLSLQRLLVIAGQDPGPVDGLIGRNTRNALAAILGAEAYEMEVSEAVSALDRWMCNPSEN